jgi:hypothetical protein
LKDEPWNAESACFDVERAPQERFALFAAIGSCLLSCRRSESRTPGFTLGSGLRPVAEIERALVTVAAANGAPRCVGSVIASAAAESLVLTAAHCLHGNGGARFVKPVLAAQSPVQVKLSRGF